jgi:hypothetical protein
MPLTDILGVMSYVNPKPNAGCDWLAVNLRCRNGNTGYSNYQKKYGKKWFAGFHDFMVMVITGENSFHIPD